MLTNATPLGATFIHPIRVYWEDTDAGGIVFYANYLKFFERARTEWLRSLGIEQQALREQTGGMFVVSETSLKYHRPARLDDLLNVTAQLQELGRVSLTIKQSALLNKEQTVLISQALEADSMPKIPLNVSSLRCEGMIRIGWVDATITQACENSGKRMARAASHHGLKQGKTPLWRSTQPSCP